MADSPLLPGSHSGPVDPKTGLWRREWYGFLRDLVRFVQQTSGNSDSLTSVLDRLEALENEPAVEVGSVIGDMTVDVQGILANGGVVLLRLLNDAIDPGTTYYYGTNADGEKGWHLLGDALLEGPGITLSVDGTTGEITIALADLADAGGGSFLLFTRDAQGRVSGTSAGTAADVPVDDAGWSQISGANAQAAFDSADTALANKQPLDATLTALAGANWSLNALPIGTGADMVSQVAFAANTFPARASTGDLVAKAITDGALSALAGSGGTAGFLRGDGSVSSALTGGLSVDTNVLFVDNTNNRVGMNTSSPQRPLHVVGPSGPVASFPSGPGAANLLILENNANSSFATVFAAGSSSSFAGFVSGAANSSFAFTYNDALGAWQFAVGTTLPFTLINTGKVRLSLAIERTGVISPAQITSNQTGYNPTGLSTASVLRLNLDADRTINSMAVPGGGAELLIFNRSAFALTLLHDDGATGTASERFLGPGSANYVIPPNGGGKVWYDTASSRWRIVGA